MTTAISRPRCATPSLRPWRRLRRAAEAAGLAASLAALAAAGGAQAANWAQRSYENFSPAEARKAQRYLRQAMAGPMDKAAGAASQIRADDMLDYGLGLVLGRAPARDALDEAGRKRVDTLLQTAMAVYQKDLGPGVTLGPLDDAVNQGELWVWMSRMLSLKPQTSIDVQTLSDPAAGVSPTAPMTPDPAGENLTTGTLDIQDGQLLGPDGRAYTLNGDLPVLDPRVVSAAHSCADYAYTAARMARVVALDPDGQSVPRARMVDLQHQAADLVRTAARQGPGACGGGDFFLDATRFAANNLGKVGTLKLLAAPTNTLAPAIAPGSVGPAGVHP